MFTVSVLVLYLLFASNKMQNTFDFCLAVGHKYVEFLYLYLELLTTLLDQIRSTEIVFSAVVGESNTPEPLRWSIFGI